MKTVPSDANPPVRLLMAISGIFGVSQPEWMVQAPGRDMWIAAIIVTGHEYEVQSADADASVKFSHRSAKTKSAVNKRPLPGWARYPAGVVAHLGDAGLAIPGFHALVLGDEPAGPRYDFGLGLVFATFCHVLTDTPYTSALLIDVVENVRRDYLNV